MSRMRDVAERAGVSTATVSRAYSSPERVSPEVRERIMRAALDLNYTLNLVARNLSRNESGAVLVVVPDIGNPFFSKILKGIESRARDLSYSVLIGDIGSDPGQIETFARDVAARRADGLILLNGRAPALNMAEVPGEPPRERPLGYPVVVVSERIPDARLPTVGIDNVAAAKAAVLHLIEAGHRRVAHIAGPVANVLTKERLVGYLAAMRSVGLEPDAGAIVHGDFSIASGRQAVRAFMGIEKRPSAIFASNDEMAMGAIGELKRLGLSVPGDVAVVGFDDIEFSEICDPPLTTIHQPRFEMGQVAMSLLVRRLRGDIQGDEEIVLPAELIVRASTTG
jgi:LacI family repressor for deo operon, udp, cdd, tsx, nupC, and nupG